MAKPLSAPARSRLGRRLRIVLHRRRARRRRRAGLGPGLSASLTLHGLAALLLFGGWSGRGPMPPPDEAVAVELVAPGPPSAGQAAAGPPEALTTPQPQVGPPRPAPPPEPPAPSAEKPAPVPARPKAPDRRPAKAAAPADGFTAMLDSLRHLRSPARGPARGAATAGAGPAARGGQSVRDVVRAQIERHWNFDVSSLAGRRLAVSLHVVLAADGTVRRAEPVEDGQSGGDPAWRPAADSIRRAALVASPLQLPPGLDDAARDMVLTFRPQDVLR